jgi:hypothetical protein
MHQKWIFLVLLVFVLTGCVPSETETPIDTDNIIDSVTYVRSLSVVDWADDFDFELTDLKLYEDPRYEDIHYVDLDEFMDLMTSGLSFFTIEKNTSYTIKIPVYSDDGSTIQYTYQLSIHPQEDLLYYNDFNFAFALTGEGKTEYLTELEVISSEQSGPSSELTIDLKPYGIDLLHVEDTFYIPLDLANLILTGYQLSLYRHESSLYVFDSLSNIQSMFSYKLAALPTTESILVDTSFRYSALLFDYFYGLKSHHKVNSYLETFTSKKFDEAQTISAFSGNFTQFIFDSNDLHTSVMDYGYKKASVSSLVSPTPYSKTVSYLSAYIQHCRHVEGDFQMTEYEDAYLLSIYQFNQDTKDKLHSVMSEVKPDKDIYIDLSCNSGGNVIGAIELLTYMTNDPIEIHYMNATTKTMYKETYLSKTPRALENRFFVVTTFVSFSAANIFTSVVQDMDLAMVIGHKTAGGAAAVGVAVLPNNLVMSYSTTMVFVNKHGVIIEDGVRPDVEMENHMYLGDIIAESRYFFASRASFTLQDSSSISEGSILMKIHSTPTGMEMTGVSIEVHDVLSQETIIEYQSNENEFTFKQDLGEGRKLIEVRMIAHYSYMGHSFDEVIHEIMLDELNDTMNEDTVTLDIGEVYETSKHREDDVDYIRIEIMETDIYRIKLNGHLTSGYEHKIYDASGTLVSQNWYHHYTPGVYYIWINLREMDFLYTIQIERMYDDNFGGTELIVYEGIQTVSLTFDFIKDQEWIILTMTEEMKVTLTVDKDLGTSFNISHIDGTNFHPYSANLNSGAVFILPIGTYHITFQRDTEGTFLFQFEAEHIPGDLSGDHTLSDARFGVFSEGPLSLLFESNYDRDIYVIETVDTTEIYFSGSNEVRVCLIQNAKPMCKQYGEPFIVTAGTHHFMFVIYTSESPLSVTLDVVFLGDLSDENNMLPIILDVPFDVIIERDQDIDYYTLSVPVATTYQLSMIDGFHSSIKVYDQQGVMVAGGDHGNLIFHLVPGEYVIRIGERVSGLRIVLKFVTTVSIYAIQDQDPNRMGWDPTYYRTVEEDITTENPIQASIDYKGDNDYFIIVIKNSGIYHFFTNNWTYMHYYLIDSKGKETRVQSGSFQLAAGTYYLRVYSSHTSVTSPIEYAFGIYKQNS